jgi:hypothetical protein
VRPRLRGSCRHHGPHPRSSTEEQRSTKPSHASSNLAGGTHGRAEQSGVLTALSQRRPRVRIPSRPPHRVVAQLGRARASGARGHRIESGQPDDGPAHAGGPHRKMALSGGQPASKTGPSATTRVRLLHLPRDHLPRDHLPLAQRTERLGPNETDPGSSPGREARQRAFGYG